MPFLSARAIGVACLAFVAPLALGAQISVGDTIRWQSAGVLARFDAREGVPDQGIVVRQDGSTLVVQRWPRGDTVTVPFANMHHTELLRGSRRRGWKAVAIGTLIGAGLGGAAGLAAGTTGGGDEILPAPIAGVLGAIVGGAFGTMVGGVAAVVTRVDNWVPVAPFPSIVAASSPNGASSG